MMLIFQKNEDVRGSENSDKGGKFAKIYGRPLWRAPKDEQGKIHFIEGWTVRYENK